MLFRSDPVLSLGVASRDGRGVSALALGNSGTWRVARRIEAAAPALADVATRLQGAFRCAEAETTLCFQIEGDALAVRRLDGPERLVGRATPIAPGLLRGWLDEIPGGFLWRFDPDAVRVDRLTWNTLRVRRLVFERVA